MPLATAVDRITGLSPVPAEAAPFVPRSVKANGSQ